MTSTLRRGAIMLGLIAVAALILFCSPGCNLADFDPEALNKDAQRYRAFELMKDEHLQRHPEQRQSFEDMLNEWKKDIEANGGTAYPPPLLPR